MPHHRAKTLAYPTFVGDGPVLTATDADGEVTPAPGLRLLWGPLDTFGPWLRMARERGGEMTLTTAAKELAVSPAYLSKLETVGTAKAPALGLLVRVAEVYRYDIRLVLHNAGYVFEVDPGAAKLLDTPEVELWAEFERSLDQVPMLRWEFVAARSRHASRRNGLYKLFLRPTTPRSDWWGFESHIFRVEPDYPEDTYEGEDWLVMRGTANLLEFLEAQSEHLTALHRALELVRTRLGVGEQE